MGVGFFFSLGHSSIVFALALAFTVGIKGLSGAVAADGSWLHSATGLIGPTVSGTFLWIIGILNLIVLVDIIRIFREMRGGAYDRERIENRLLERGMMSRFFGRFFRLINHSWQMYPLGLLFGLGFDTATEVGLLALAAGVATHSVPVLAILSLPILFAAGMSLMDTLDGAFMSQAYGWAFSNPVRKVYYNITITSLSVVVALVIGTVELLQVLSTKLALTGGPWDTLNDLNFETLGYGIVALFLLMWAASVAIWKLRRIEDRWGEMVTAKVPVDR